MVTGFRREFNEIRSLLRCVTPRKIAYIRIQEVYMHRS